MFAEDMDLCWRAHRAGAEVGTAPDAVVTHVEGVSRRVAPYRMQVAHHRSALRFAVTTTTGPARLLLPVAALILGIRLAAVLVVTTPASRATCRRRRRARQQASTGNRRRPLAYDAGGLRAGLWLKVEASRRRNDPRKATLVAEHGAA